MNEQKTIIFLHIPKAAGTTLHRIIERQYARDETFTIDGESVEASIEVFKRRPVDFRRGLRCVKGHMVFGLHQRLPQPSTYITMLRDPVDRLVSHYHYVLSRPRHYLHEAVKRGNMSLEDYVSSGISDELTNGQARLLAGEQADVLSDADLLESARSNLVSHFSVVGLMERFEESLLLCARRFNWKSIRHQPENVGADRPVRAALPSRTIDVIRRYNRVDCELYEWAQRAFDATIECEGEAFQSQLRSLRETGDVSASFEAALVCG